MATLLVKLDEERAFALTKSVTSIGRGPQNDIRIALGDVRDRHAHILKDRNGFRIFATDGATIQINGKKRVEWSLADGDEIDLGGIKARYRVADPMGDDTTEPSSAVVPVRSRDSSITESVPLEAFKKLYRFSAKISDSPTLDAMKENLVDAVIALARADTGFLLVIDETGAAAIDLARSRAGADLPKEDAKLSDSIVLAVIEQRKPLVLSDAMEDSIFSDSRSVVNYQLRSVIAVPIVLGDEILGVLYLGCDRKTSAFSAEFLDILMVFAAQAGLLVKNAMLVTELREDNEALKEELESRAFGEIVGESSSMQGIFKAAARFAPTDITVLIRGETGTGKEMIAREIHRRSSRAEGPFVAINVSAIPENLLEAELFGHVRGAFTGAVTDRLGKFAEADGGTLFLDEIGDMPLSLQAKILRVLQERTIVRIGSNEATAIDIRVISATHRDLQAMQEDGAFRPDLFFRLNEVDVVLPPLRDRGEDVVLLASYFLSKYSEQMNRKFRRFTPRATAAMKRFGWRGNVRQLEGKVKKAVVMAEGPDIDVTDLQLEEGGMASIMSLRDAKEAYANRYIREVLDLNDGNRSKTARDLGVDPRTIYKYLEGK